MGMRRAGGWLIVLGLVLTIGASVVFPVEYFMTEGESQRQAIVAANQVAWVVANWMWVVGGVATGAGMLLVCLKERDPILIAGAGLFGVGNAFWVAYGILRSLEPRFSSEGLWMEALFAWVTAVGLALMGIPHLRGRFARWVGYVNVAYALLFVATFALLGAEMYEFFPPQAVFLVALATAIASLRRQGEAGLDPR